MKINVIKEHPHYAIGEHEVTEERGNYLIKMGVAVAVEEKVLQVKKEMKVISPKKALKNKK